MTDTLQNGIFDKIALKIIQEQELVVGPLAWIEAAKVQGLNLIDRRSAQILEGNADPKEIINGLVSRYERLFGEASHEVCREAALPLVADLSPSDIPSSLQ